MDPSTLEMLLMQRLNRDMWSEKTVQDVIDDEKVANRRKLKMVRTITIRLLCVVCVYKMHDE